MKIIEEVRKNPEGTTDIRFIIVGDRKEGSVEIPMWEKRLVLSNAEVVTTNLGVLSELRRDNAVDVFEKYYHDTFMPYPQAKD